MSGGVDLEPLQTWNELNRKNTEDDVIKSMYEACAKSSEPVDLFVTWLLVGSAAVGSFWVVNSDKLVPYIGKTGFMWCGLFLCVSCFFGLLSKMYALQIKVRTEIISALNAVMQGRLDLHDQQEQKILEAARLHGVELETEIRVERIFSVFLSPLPAWLRNREIRKAAKNGLEPHAGHRPLLRFLAFQSFYLSLQSLGFFGFLCAGFIFVVAH
ncbi:hypothetical protein HZU75_04405 [Chitinibacter fontanus]|uniref:Uncharacterized protein n=1 Tax=Chitinibacter fontanus TaxID=1737446 RepID=A0A7D5V9M0_9NEIS|nr:hypothetical protein [Chitinibacter fontanus]QLI80833.1 hypothetical protein HZU75_04405 [Chitinibacter fontanus]